MGLLFMTPLVTDPLVQLVLFALGLLFLMLVNESPVLFDLSLPLRAPLVNKSAVLFALGRRFVGVPQVINAPLVLVDIGLQFVNRPRFDKVPIVADIGLPSVRPQSAGPPLTRPPFANKPRTASLPRN